LLGKVQQLNHSLPNTSLSILTAFSQVEWVGRYQNVSTLDFIGVKGYRGGVDNWSYETCKATVKSSPPTNHHPAFYRPDAIPVAQSTVSQHWGKTKITLSNTCCKIFISYTNRQQTN